MVIRQANDSVNFAASNAPRAPILHAHNKHAHCMCFAAHCKHSTFNKTRQCGRRCMPVGHEGSACCMPPAASCAALLLAAQLSTSCCAGGKGRKSRLPLWPCCEPGGPMSRPLRVRPLACLPLFLGEPCCPNSASVRAACTPQQSEVLLFWGG